MWRRGCQSKRFCFISFVFATEASRVGLARAKGGEGEGHCLIAGQNLFIPFGSSGSSLEWL